MESLFFQEYKTPISKESYILIKECEVSLLQLDNIYFIESSLDNDNNGNIFSKYVSKIFTIIKDAINRFIKIIIDFFKDDNHITPDDYLNSKVGQIRLSKDIEKVNKQIDDEIIKGSNLIQTISNKTKVDDHIVAEFLNRVSSILRTGKNTIIKNTVARAVLKSSIKKCEKNKDKIDNIEKTVNESSKDLDAESKEQIQKILKALRDLVNGYISNYTEILSKLNTTGGKE